MSTKLSLQQEAGRLEILGKNPKLNTGWNIDDYRKPYEPKNLWKLRKDFMERHQHWIPENELVCLAQAFVNIELLHCMYPQEIMLRVEKLAKGIADENQGYLGSEPQSTLVQKQQNSGPHQQGRPAPPIEESSKKFRPVVPIRTIEDVYNNIVLLDNNFNKTQQRFDMLGCDKMEVASRICSGKAVWQIKVGSFVLDEAHKKGKKLPKDLIHRSFFAKMSQHCYTLNHRGKQRTKKYVVERVKLDGMVDYRGRATAKVVTETKIDESNLGFKMLQKLGWTGGALGLKNQGLLDPISVAPCKASRLGLGAEPQKGDNIGIRDKIYEIDVNFYRQKMRDFRDSGESGDLFFSSEFTVEERTLFNMMAHQLKMKSRTQSKQFVLSGKGLMPHEILHRILVKQDPELCERYIVQPPKGRIDKYDVKKKDTFKPKEKLSKSKQKTRACQLAVSREQLLAPWKLPQTGSEQQTESKEDRTDSSDSEQQPNDVEQTNSCYYLAALREQIVASMTSSNIGSNQQSKFDKEKDCEEDCSDFEQETDEKEQINRCHISVLLDQPVVEWKLKNSDLEYAINFNFDRKETCHDADLREQ